MYHVTCWSMVYDPINILILWGKLTSCLFSKSKSGHNYVKISQIVKQHIDLAWDLHISSKHLHWFPSYSGKLMLENFPSGNGT